MPYYWICDMQPLNYPRILSIPLAYLLSDRPFSFNKTWEAWFIDGTDGRVRSNSDSPFDWIVRFLRVCFPFCFWLELRRMNLGESRFYFDIGTIDIIILWKHLICHYQQIRLQSEKGKQWQYRSEETEKTFFFLVLRMENNFLFFFTILEKLETHIDDVSRIGFDVSEWDNAYLSYRDLIRFMTMLRMWNSLFFSSDIFYTCLAFSIYIYKSFIVKPFSARRVVASPLPPLPLLKSETLLPYFYRWAFSEAKTSKIDPETCCSLK